MAVLHAKTGEVAMTFRPYQVAEKGQPTWVRTELKLSAGARELLSTTLNVTTDDLAELRARLKDLSPERCAQCYVSTTDDDFVLLAEVLNWSRDVSNGDVSIGFWTGEPYGLMRGYRFVTRANDVEHFAEQLVLDERAAGATTTLD